MKEIIKRIFLMLGMVILVTSIAGCSQQDDVLLPIEETYVYSSQSKNYVRPAVVDGWVELTALKTTAENDTFFCFTEDTARADDFINAQRTLLRFLRDHGVETGKMECYGTDYGYCFSLSDDAAAYVDFSAVRSWQQVLVTLQAIWGDYTDYGYVYAMANAIARELGWQADDVPSIDNASLDEFFAENPGAVHLLYPTFTTEFASEETVKSCKALSRILLDKIKWYKALAKPIEEQLDGYYSLLSDYVQNIDVPFTRQVCGYASYGDSVLLRIMMTYAELMIDGEYMDHSYNLFGDYFGDYQSLYQTVNTIDAEICTAVSYFGVEDKAGVIKIKFLPSGSDSAEKFTKGRGGYYYSSTDIAYVTSLAPLMHEYYHHLEYVMTQSVQHVWQRHAFCEIGRAYSRYGRYQVEYANLNSEEWSDLFRLCTGREFEGGLDDYYEAVDILCYISDDFHLTYWNSGAAPLSSVRRYLIDLYGEKVCYDILLHPETIEDVTGKTWKEMEADWAQHIRDKYAAVELPDWVKQ